MTTVGTLSTDLGPGNNSLADVPLAPTNSIPLIVTTAADDTKSDKLATAPVDGAGIKYIQACSKLDMEPNPFEQSFLGSATTTTTNSAVESTSESSKTVLPPIASMSNRLAPNTDQFGWDKPSLRMGPLSPSMLEGPQEPVVFEKTTATSLPLSSAYPATTAPISTMYTSGAPIAENGFPFVSMAGNSAALIQPTTGGPIPPTMYNQQPPVTQMPSQHGAPAQQRHPQSFGHPNSQTPMNDRYMAPHGGQHLENPNGYGNLHLLSQAQATHREMWIKRESIDGNAHLVPGQQPPHQHQQSSQPNITGMPVGNTAQQQFSSKGSAQRSRMTSEEHSDDSERSSKPSNERSSKKRSATDDKMDEEEKRRNFLERNRQAALKCRQRKKQWLSNLQAKVEYLTTDNEHLQTQTAALRDEIIHLKALLLAHKDCPVARANGVFPETISVSSGNHSHNHSHSGMSHGSRGASGSQPSGSHPSHPRGDVSNGSRGSLPAHMQTGGGTRMSIPSTAATAGSAVSSGGVRY